MADDILFNIRRSLGKPDLNLTEAEIQFHTLAAIDTLLKSLGKSLKDFPQLPQPPPNYLESCTNNLILEETNYDVNEMEKEYKDLLSKCNEDQLKVYDAVLKSVDNNEGTLFFVYGSGGCGKTFLWRTLICKLRSIGKIVLPVASSRIAATLLPDGRTSHSRFKIPIVLDEFSLYSIGHNSDVAELLKRTSLIIWDEAPMQHRYGFECLDRYLRDLMKNIDPQRFHMPFGGITVVFGGDLRQILPVIRYGSRDDVVSACITRSKLWLVCRVFLLHHNMCLKKTENSEAIEALSIFTKWVLDIGDGKNIRSCNVEKIPGESVSYFSVDKAVEFGGTYTELEIAFPDEYLNDLNIPGLPHHELKFKVGVVVMLMRNLNQTIGLCNGTRMMITKCLKFCLECEVICGSFIGTRHFIPRMECCPSDTKLPFKLLRKQMPLQICYAMTINKSQGQSLQNAGLYLPNPVFTHGQFYVAISRVTSSEGLKIFIDDESGNSTNTTKNVVYKEVFYNVPSS